MGKTSGIGCQKKLNAAKAHLVRCLACTEPGERLPSIRELIAGGGTSRTDVEKALLLQEDIKIRRVFRSWIYRAGEKTRSGSRIILKKFNCATKYPFYPLSKTELGFIIQKNNRKEKSALIPEIPAGQLKEKV